MSTASYSIGRRVMPRLIILRIKALSADAKHPGVRGYAPPDHPGFVCGAEDPMSTASYSIGRRVMPRLIILRIKALSAARMRSIRGRGAMPRLTFHLDDFGQHGIRGGDRF
jgi:hypothetical protein